MALVHDSNRVPLESAMPAAVDLVEGRSSPLGATIFPGGANFSLFSRSASGVELLLFDREEGPIPLTAGYACALNPEALMPSIDQLKGMVKKLLSERFAAQRRKRIDPQHAHPGMPDAGEVSGFQTLRSVLPQTPLRRLGLVPYYVGATCGPRQMCTLVREAGFEVKEVEALMHCPRVLAVAAARLIDRHGSPALQRRFLGHLARYERLAAWPTRHLTSYFTAVRAVRTG